MVGWFVIGERTEGMNEKLELRLLTNKELNTIRGKALVGKATPHELAKVFFHIDKLEEWLNEYEKDDTFGTEGWRHAFGHPDAG